MASVIIGLIRECPPGDRTDRILARLDQRWNVDSTSDPLIDVTLDVEMSLTEARDAVAMVAAGADPEWGECFRFAEA